MIYNGKHYILDAIAKDAEALDRPQASLQFINTLVQILDMSLIVAPTVIEFPFTRSELSNSLKKLEEDGLKESQAYTYLEAEMIRRQGVKGHTAYGVIAESHIALHTFPTGNFIQIDVSSCKEFNDALVRELAIETYGLISYRDFIIDRNFESLKNRWLNKEPNISYRINSSEAIDVKNSII